MKIVAIIQARMGSTRRPGKVMADIEGRPLLAYVVARAGRAQLADQVVVATTDRALDDIVFDFCESERVACFRGNEDDVLDRYYQAARKFEANVIVRLTADCPLLDPAVIDRVVETFLAGNFDYVSNTYKRTYPDGLDTEIITRNALERAWREARLPAEREHVTPYIYGHPELFRLGYVFNNEDLGGLRWTVDEPSDLDFVRAVYKKMGKADFGMLELLSLLREDPEFFETD